AGRRDRDELHAHDRARDGRPPRQMSGVGGRRSLRALQSVARVRQPRSPKGAPVPSGSQAKRSLRRREHHHGGAVSSPRRSGRSARPGAGAKKAAARKRPEPANETGQSGRAMWTGSIGFGLVQIPVRLFPRERNNDLAFHQVDKRDGSLIGYERVNKATHKPVAWNDIAKGYEIQKGQFVIVTDDDFEKANVAASQTVEIQDFVSASEIPVEYC